MTKYTAEIEFEAPSADAAKEILDELLNEADSLSAYNGGAIGKIRESRTGDVNGD